ncbi:hypothetical protein CLIB1423_02S05732 [[Candida] railenensis]|uniref:Uncharacterized protein n=1 Tax=[Candida] railenensis TaxID=45579 RepID=A0A9P0QLF3_9ASCO|nr:hypothetical protein CLIB1423_02S05732 [[Candida] railenensis]
MSMESSLPDISFLKFNNEQSLATGTQSTKIESSLNEAKISSIYERFPDLELGSDVLSSRNVSNSINKVQDQFDALKRLVKIFLEVGNYSMASKTLHQFANQTHFFSQPNTVEDFANNRYLELLFYQYAVYIQQLWFDRGKLGMELEKAPPIGQYSVDPKESSGLSKLFGRIEPETKTDTSAGITVTLNQIASSSSDTTSNVSTSPTAPILINPETIYKKAVTYFTKCNTFIFNKKQFHSAGTNTYSSTGSASGAPESSEISYYYLISLLRLTELFRKGEYLNYYTEFVNLLETNAVCGISPEDVLLDVQCRYTLKRDLVIMLGISSVLALPFKDLSFLNSRELEKTRNLIIDLFTLDANETGQSLPILIYRLLVELSESSFHSAKEMINDKTFRDSICAQLDHILSMNKAISIDFLDFFTQTIDLKIFLMIISHVKRIPRVKLLFILGYKEEHSNAITETLLSFMSCLNLGESGIGYDVMGDFFFNNGQANRMGALKRQIDQLSADIKGDSLAELVHGVLMERYLST